MCSNGLTTATILFVLTCRLQTALLHMDDLEAALRQRQAASGAQTTALRGEQARWGHLTDRVQRLLDRADPHGSDARHLSRVLATARTRRVEALLEQQAM